MATSSVQSSACSHGRATGVSTEREKTIVLPSGESDAPATLTAESPTSVVRVPCLAWIAKRCT